MDHFEKLRLIVERKVEPLTTQQIWKNDLFRESPVGSVIQCEERNGVLEHCTMLIAFSTYIVFGTLADCTVHCLSFPRFKINASLLGFLF